MHLLQTPFTLLIGKLDRLLSTMDRISIFSFMWAVGILFHQMVFIQEWAKHDVLGWLLFLSALVLLWKPRSIALLIVMVTLSALVGLGKMPFLDNHMFFQLCADLVILFSIGWQLILHNKNKILILQTSKQNAREEIFDSFAAPARMALILLYFFAVFHKLNWGFFDPTYSHAVPLLEETTALIGLHLNDWMKITSIWTTLIIELSIAITLCLQSTRNAGIILGLAFHIMLSMNPKHVGFNSFSAMLYPLYFLFTPRNFPDQLSKMLSSIYQQWANGNRKRILWPGAVTAVVIVSICLLVVYKGNYRNLINVFGVAWGFLLSIIFIAVITLYPLRQSKFVTLFSPKWALQWIVPILLLFNGFTIYLGLKTTSAFAMFTNLRTEGGETNHLFMSKRFKIAGYIDDLVEITKTNHPDLKRFENSRIITYYELQRNAQKQQKDYFVEYRRNGKPMRLEMKNGVINDPAILVSYPWWQYKLMGFKPIEYGPHNIHRHSKASE